jgi:hypothetical protein
MSYVSLDPTDFIVSADSVTAPAWSTGLPTLTRFVTASSAAPSFYVDVYVSGSSVTDTTSQFSIAYGHLYGSGSAYYNTLVPYSSPTRTTYGQYRTLVYGDENTNFNFGAGNPVARDIFVINVNRNRYKQQLYLPTFNLTLTSGSSTVQLTNNSVDTTTVTYLDCGRAFNIVSGSNGSATTSPIAAGVTAGYTPSGSYGLYLPDIGAIVLNPRALALPPASGGINLYVPETTNTNTYNYGPLFNAISGGANFQLNSEETVSSNYAFVRVKSQDFNYTTNPSIISGSGNLNFSTLINNPQTYITTVGMYNTNNELLAVAKLSKPLVKDFTKEALIRVKLNW